MYCCDSTAKPPSSPKATVFATHEVVLMRVRYMVCPSAPLNPRATIALAMRSLLGIMQV